MVQFDSLICLHGVFFLECDSSKNTYLYKENTSIQFASYGLIWDVATNKYQVTVSWKIMDAYFLSISYFVEDRHLMQLLFKTEITFQL